jgi:sigma-E factor negative regulatory protein RseA
MHEAPAGHAGLDVREAVSASLDQGAVGDHRSHQSSRRRYAPWRWSAAAMIAFGIAIGFGAGSGWDVMSGGGPDTLVPVQAQVPAAAGVPEVTLQGLDASQREQFSRYLLEHAQNNSVAAGQGAVGYARLTSMSSSGQGY